MNRVQNRLLLACKLTFVKIVVCLIFLIYLFGLYLDITFVLIKTVKFLEMYYLTNGSVTLVGLLSFHFP